MRVTPDGSHWRKDNGQKMLGFNHMDSENVDPQINIPKKKFKRVPTIVVEGNIGSGKSTFLKYFQNFSDKIEVLPEPVHKWKDVDGYNTLDMMYKDASRWSLAFQSYVQLTMAEGHKHKAKNTKIKMMERSIFSARNCFVENLYQSKLMPEVDYAVLSEFYDFILQQENTKIDLIVYLRADPKTCQGRIKKRARMEETSVPLEYLQSLHELHESWLIKQSKFDLPAPVYEIDANEDISSLSSKFDKFRDFVFSKYSLL